MRQSIINTLSQITDEEKNYIDGKILEIDRYSESDMVIDYKKLLAHGELIQVRPHTRFVPFPKHTHNYVEMTYCIQGNLTHIIEGKEITMSEGDILLLNQNVTQEIKIAGKDDLAINFIIMPEFFDKAFLMLEERNFIWEFIISCLKTDRNETNFLYFKTQGIVPIENLIENMIWSILSKSNNLNNLTQTTMCLLLQHLSNHVEIIEFGESSFDNQLALKVFEYIENHYRTGELSYLAQDIGCELYWLSKEIKKITGETFKDLLMEKRLDQAALMLRKTDLGVTDIIEHVGYSNTSYFHRIFKKKYHCTPKSYRNNH